MEHQIIFSAIGLNDNLFFFSVWIQKLNTVHSCGPQGDAFV